MHRVIKVLEFYLISKLPNAYKLGADKKSRHNSNMALNYSKWIVHIEYG